MTGDYAAHVGRLMRAVREDRRLSLAMVEKASGGRFNRMSLQAWETARRDVKAETLAGYADWLGIDITLLLPPEEPAGDAHRRAAASATERAVTSLTQAYRSLSRAEAAALVTEALSGGEAA